MSSKTAYSFLPWLRQGLANRIGIVDELGASPVEATGASPRIDLSVQVSGDGRPVNGGRIQKTVQLYGPGDVIGIDSRAVVKTQPRHSGVDFEPNYLPYIEFYEEDFPWRYTPLKNNGDRLRPWLMLVVLEASEFSTNPVGKGDLLPSFTLKASAETAFPPADQIWAWAHVQTNQSLGLPDIYPQDEAQKTAALENLKNAIRDQPNRSCSRILCPVKLQAQTEYFAFLIPSFERGRLAGLGRKTAEIEAVSIQMPAWGQHAQQNQFPYYYHWHFRTGRAEDFEELVRRIEARQLDPQVGRRWIDIQDPGYRIRYQHASKEEPGDPETSNPLLRRGAMLMEGALRSPGSDLPVLLSAEVGNEHHWLDQLQGLLNLEADLRERNLTADHPFAQNPYFRQTTEDAENEEVSAPINIYDDPLILPPLYGRWHVLSHRVDRTKGDHWFHQLNLDPRHRIAAGFGAEVVRRKQEDYMDRAWKQYEALFEANHYLRRVTFSLALNEGLMNRHFRQMKNWQLTTLSGGIQTVVKTAPGENLKTYIHSRSVPDALLTAASEKITHPNRIILRRGRKRGPQSSPVVTRSRNAGARSKLIDIESAGDLQPLKVTEMDAVRPELSSPGSGPVHESLLGFEFGPMIEATLLNLKEKRDEYRSNYFGISGIEDAGKTAFATALKQLNDRIQFHDEALLGGQQQKLVFRSSADFILRAIQPEAASMRKVKATLEITDPQDRVTGLEQLRTLVQEPAFPDAMYEPLEAIASDHLVPNLDLIPPNTYALMETNREFIEAYMVGLNVEMARELLWREFPTDQRGTYFRRFWAAGQGPTTGAAKEDIDAIHNWKGGLGDHHSPGNPAGGKKRMVLVIRADLLRRYPQVAVYLQRAKNDPQSGVRVLGDEIIQPAFFAQIQPDIYFVGFDLTVAEAKKGPGHFFVIRERPGEMRFGLDLPPQAGEEKPAPMIWDDLHWGELTGNHKYIDLAQDHVPSRNGREKVPWVTTDEGHAAQLAWVLQQKPVLVAVHIDTVLPDRVLPENS